ncbi:MAG: hypothetical protein H7Y38_12095 [Armatimonadetes bacterium]|nr:hypothetical protein [Armatimonadota bacterium]
MLKCTYERGKIHIQLFGEVTVRFAEDVELPVRRFSTQKAAVLLALLALRC